MQQTALRGPTQKKVVVDKPPTSKAAIARAQAAITAWSDESGRSQSEISRILALSTG